MSSKSKISLTENGVRILYDINVKTTINLQVIFLACSDVMCYLRLSDGKHVTPIVAILKKHYNSAFYVGAVIAIKGVKYEATCTSNNERILNHSLEDHDLFPLIIKSFTVVETYSDGSSLLGSLNTSVSYKDAIKHILPNLKKYDHNFRYIEKNYKKAQSESNHLREQGNNCFSSGIFDRALALYDTAKGYDPYDYRLCSNSSQAYFHLEEYQQAEEEAVVSMKLNPFHYKAYYWAGQAALKQYKHKEAYNYGKRAKFLCGDDKKIKQLIEESRKQMEMSEGNKKDSKTADVSSRNGKMKLDSIESFAQTVTSAFNASLSNISSSTSIEIYHKGPQGITCINASGCNKKITLPGLTRISSRSDDEENIDPNERRTRDEEELRLKKEEKREKQSRKAKAGVEEERREQERKKKEEIRKEEEKRKREEFRKEEEKKKEEMLKEEEKKKQEAKLKERNNVSKNIYYESLKDARRYYETGQFRQALEAYGKNLAYSCPEGDKSERNGFSGCQEIREIQFIIGACKVQASLNEVLDGMEIMEYFAAENTNFQNRAVANYFLGVGFGKLCLNRMAQSKVVACEGYLKNGKSKAIKWPGSDDSFPESDPERLKVLKDELNKNNINMYPEEECIAVWDRVNLDPSITRRASKFDSFNDRHNYMEMLLKSSVNKSKRDFLAKFSRGEHKYHYLSKSQHTSGELVGRTSSIRPTPKAKCRFKDCITTQGHTYAKEEIYDTDPEFKGYVDVICEECCTVTYHPCCWKAHKEQQEDQFGKMSDKDFLGTECVTPDCIGKINAILIHDETGSLKHDLVANKKDKKNGSTPVKQKKKKEKKKGQPSKPQPDTKDRKKVKQESTSEDTIQKEEAVAAASSKPEPPPKSNSLENNEKDKVPSPVSNLPIDPESLDKVKTILKPPVEEEPAPLSKTSKKKKKNKKPKETIQPDFLGDPLDEETTATNEYVARLRLLRQQREAQELDAQNVRRATGSTQPYASPVVEISQWLDPENPFYLPQHLRDNPEELERILQTKMIASSSPDLDNNTIKTLLDFVYDWLKSQGPMSINDDRLRKYVSENFPQEALTHVNHCGGIKQFLMQSIDFAMIDEVICVRDHVVRAQDLTKKTVSERMMTSKFLISDGRKAKKFTHLLDDTKSSCSSSSSASQLGSSGLSYNSKTTSESTVPSAKPTKVEMIKVDKEPSKPKPIITVGGVGELDTFATVVPKASANQTKAKPLPTIGGVGGLDTFEMPACSPSNLYSKLKPSLLESQESNDGEDEEDEEEEDEDKEVEEAPWQTVGSRKEILTPITLTTNPVKSLMLEEEVRNTLKSKMDAGEEILITSQDEERYQSEEDEEEEEAEEAEEAEVEPEEEIDDSSEENGIFIESLKEELEEVKRGMKMLNEQNQKLNDKLIQVKSSTSIEISSLKRQVEELRAEKRVLEGDKQSLAAGRESEARKFKAEMSRMQDEVKSFQSRHTSLEHKYERSIDHTNEIDAKLLEEQEVSTQLREEVKNLQESLTSSSRRAHEAEVKYLCTKKDLTEAHFNRTIERLTVEVVRMRQLLQHASEYSIPDRATLSRSIIAWDEHIKSLRDRKRTFMEEGKRLLGMVNQGRPLNALPPGDLDIPIIPETNIAPLLSIVPNAKKPPTALPAAELLQDWQGSGGGATRSPTLSLITATNGLPMSTPTDPLEATKMLLQNALATTAAFNSGAIPKGTTANPLPTGTCTITASDGTAAQKYPDSHKLFVGQIPWDYTESDVKKLFSDRIGEVVGVTVYDKGFTPDGKAVPKYGFVTFRNADDQEKALNCGPIMVGNHQLNIQAKESKKPTKPTNIAVGGSTSAVSEAAGLKCSSSAYGLSDISLNATAEANKSVMRTLSTPTIHQPNPTPVTKPKFQNLTSSNNVGAIGTLPPKLVRPQPRQPANGKGVNQSNVTTKEDAASNSAAYKKLIETCKQRAGKDYSLPDVQSALREVRMKNNNSLSGLTTEVIVERVKQQLRARRPGSGQATVAPWAGLTQGPAGNKAGGPDWQGPTSAELPPEEQCSICLDALNSSPTLQLQCQHVFHEKCIGGWLKRQSNCPNCRTFALMADEYPSLTH